MKSFLIMSPHTPAECLKTLDHVLAAGYLTHFKWGCPPAEPTGYVMLDAESSGEALMAVPPFVRSKARVVELIQFDSDHVRALHQK